MKRILCLILVFGAACNKSAPVPPVTDTDAEYVEFFMQRGSSSAIEFEQYKISSGGIFVECGELARGRLEPKSQTFIPSDTVNLDTLREKIHTVKRVADADTIKMLPSPAKGTSMFDGGQLSLSIGEGENAVALRTTVNAVADGATPLTNALKSFSVTLRSTLKNDTCGKNDFYGIPGSS